MGETLPLPATVAEERADLAAQQHTRVELVEHTRKHRVAAPPARWTKRDIGWALAQQGLVDPYGLLRDDGRFDDVAAAATQVTGGGRSA